MYYAHIGNDNIVFALSSSAEKINSQSAVKIPAFDESLLGAVYINGEFVQSRRFVIPDGGIICKIIILHPDEPVPLGGIEITREQSFTAIGAKCIDGEFIMPDPQAEMEDRIVERVAKSVMDSFAKGFALTT